VRRKTPTLKFLTGEGIWASEFELAKQFASSAEAVRFCLTHGIKNVEVVLRLGDPVYDVVINIGDG
jgi:hypothetical protein